MSLFKGKGNVWSQLLLSMIAFFALPQVSAVDATPVPNEPHQTQTQQHQQHILGQAAQAQLPDYLSEMPQSAVNFSHVFNNEPCFLSRVFAEHAPIRAGPII